MSRNMKNNNKFIAFWTIGLSLESAEIRYKIEAAFQVASQKKDDWFYKVVVDGKDYFVADNGECGYTAMLPDEY
jgi:hypothetical protein